MVARPDNTHLCIPRLTQCTSNTTQVRYERPMHVSRPNASASFSQGAMSAAMIRRHEDLDFDSPSPDIRNNPKRARSFGNSLSGELPREYSDLHALQLQSMLSLEERSHSGLICSDLQPEFTSDHRFFLVQWIHSVRSARSAFLFPRSIAVSAYRIASSRFDTGYNPVALTAEPLR